MANSIPGQEAYQMEQSSRQMVQVTSLGLALVLSLPQISGISYQVSLLQKMKPKISSLVELPPPLPSSLSLMSTQAQVPQRPPSLPELVVGSISQLTVN